jgi:hypothetical protein
MQRGGKLFYSKIYSKNAAMTEGTRGRKCGTDLSARPGDRQADIGIHDKFVDEALTSSASTMYWAHPQSTSRSRSSYTLHSSSNGGATWDFASRVYGGGAGYSDAIVVADPAVPGGETLLMAFQKTFTPPVLGVEGGGYDVGLARLPL